MLGPSEARNSACKSHVRWSVCCWTGEQQNGEAAQPGLAQTSALCSYIQAGSLLTEKLHADAGLARSRKHRLHATRLAITMLQEKVE